MRTLIAVPCMDMMHTQFVHSLLGLRLNDDYEVRFVASSLIYVTRNLLVDFAIEKGFDRILWFDSDMVFTPDVVRYLNEDLDNGCDIVCGLAFMRKPPYQPVIFDSCNLSELDDGTLQTSATIYKDYPKDKLFEVAACGFGCVMMNVPAVKRIAEKFGNKLFTPLAGFGEDLTFCMYARSAEVKVWCDSRAKVGHVGEMVFNEDFYLKDLNNGTS